MCCTLHVLRTVCDSHEIQLQYIHIERICTHLRNKELGLLMRKIGGKGCKIFAGLYLFFSFLF